MTGTRRFASLRALLLAVLVISGAAGGGFVVLAQSPMNIPPIPAEDEPEAAGEPEAPPATRAPVIAPLPPVRPGATSVSPGAAPAPRTASQPVYPVVDAPVPPVRPFLENGASPAAPPAGSSTTIPPAAPPAASPPPATPEAPPVTAEPQVRPVEPHFEIEPNMRVFAGPLVQEQSTTAEIEAEEARTPEPNIAEKQTDAVDVACLKAEVLEFVRLAGAHFGATPIITSGQRDRGRRGSFHRRCMAADFFVPGIERAALAKYLRGLPGAGGVGTYCHTRAVHIDLGEPRNWYQCGRRFRFAQR